MQAYGENFAHVYNQKWIGFAQTVAPLLLDFYEATPSGKNNKSILDLCCGTGQLAVHFLEKGYRVVGLDLSPAMLHYARENAHAYTESGQADFVHGDASNFTFDERFGLVVSTFDALNHLENMQALKQCFQCASAICEGYFIFDLNTRRGLQRWNSINVDESNPDILLITRGIYDGQSDKAWTRLNGFTKLPNGLYERFEEVAFNSAFDMVNVKHALLDVGWQHVHFAKVQDLATPLADPEAEGRVFIVASKQ